MRALAFEHLASDPLGIFGDVLSERGIAVDRVLLYEGEPVPDWRDYDLIVAMGAGASVWQEDEYPWIRDEKRAVREAVLAGIPYFGICFGVQLLADVFGARSFQGPEPEIGVNQVFLTANAQHDPVFRGFPPDLEVCEWHSNHFSLPPGAVRLARSPRYENQAIRYGRVAYGIQSHLEPPLEDIRAWLDEFPETKVLFEERHGEGAVARLLDDYAEFVPFLQETGRQLFGRWLQNALALGAPRPSSAPQPTAAGPDRLPGLVGRDVELAKIDGAIAAARRGESAVLVLRGEAGIGKSALLSAAADRAFGLRVLRATGEQGTDAEFPFAGLADLCRPIADRRQALAPRRAAAIDLTLEAVAEAPIHDRFAVYAGAFDLLVSTAAEIPLLVLVDDAHLVDDASREAIAFIARRLGSDGIALLVATESADDLAFTEDIRLGPLEPPDARSLLNRRWAGELAAAVAEVVVTAAAGNPLALLELPHDLSGAQRRGEAVLEGPLPPSVEWAFLSRIAALPVAARQALLVAALAGPDENEAIAAACETLGVNGAARQTSETSGLFRQEAGGLRFTHPLARAVTSYSAARADRRATHAALADVTDGDARTWHRARAAVHADEEIASGLERIAIRARERTAFAAAATCLERAARLTPARELRARRLLDASRAAHLAGHVNASLDHVDAALRHVESEQTRREAEHLRGRILARSGSAEVARDQLVATAGRCERDDPRAAAEMLAGAVLPALRAGGPSEAVRLARRAERLSGAAGGVALATEVALGTALIFVGEYEEGVARLDAAAQRSAEARDQQELAYLGAGLGLAGRHDAAARVLTHVIDDARAAGALSVLPYALIRLAEVQLETGQWPAASAALHEAVEVARETGLPADAGLALGALAWMAGARGSAEDCRVCVEEALQIASRLGGGSRLDRAGTAAGLLELGLGHPEAAIAYLESACRLQDEQGWSDAGRTPHRRPDLIEAYALAGRREDASAALEQFRVDAERTQRPSALAALARCRALLAGDGEIDDAFTAALSAGNSAAGPFERARTKLLYGIRLLGSGRPEPAADVLAGALATFERLAARSWAERTRTALIEASGEAPAPRLALADRLTPRELEVAVAGSDGASAGEIAQRLFLGPRTVRMQLASAVIKLDLNSSAELASVLSEDSLERTAAL
jgi:GMP synthase-like glutamine amidotransferase/DNA-binding NarL/FixJ family response regulator/tetratricopeptide (TPR) repeat protein